MYSRDLRHGGFKMNKQKMQKYAQGLEISIPDFLELSQMSHLNRYMAENCLQECFFYREDFKKIDIDLGLSFWRLWKWRHRDLFPQWNPPAKAFKRMEDTLEGYTIAGKPAIQWCNL